MDIERHSWVCVAGEGSWPGQVCPLSQSKSISHTEQSKLWSPSKPLAVFQLTLKAGLWDLVCFIRWNAEKQPLQLIKRRGTKQCPCTPANPCFPCPFYACNWPDCTPSLLDSCNFLTNLSMTCNFPFYIAHEFECLLILVAPYKSNGSDCVIVKPWTGSQRSYSSCEQYAWHQKLVPLELTHRCTLCTLCAWGHTHTS